MFPSFVATVKPPNKTSDTKYIYASVPYHIPSATTGIVYSSPNLSYGNAIGAELGKPEFAKSLRCNKTGPFQSMYQAYMQPKFSCSKNHRDAVETPTEYKTAVTQETITLSCQESKSAEGLSLICRRV